jgi:hypothetical protein
MPAAGPIVVRPGPGAARARQGGAQAGGPGAPRASTSPIPAATSVRPVAAARWPEATGGGPGGDMPAGMVGGGTGEQGATSPGSQAGPRGGQGAGSGSPPVRWRPRRPAGGAGGRGSGCLAGVRWPATHPGSPPGRRGPGRGGSGRRGAEGCRVEPDRAQAGPQPEDRGPDGDQPGAAGWVASSARARSRAGWWRVGGPAPPGRWARGRR